MRNIITLLLATTFLFSATAQNMVGKPKAEVKSYIEKSYTSDEIESGTFSDTGQDWYKVGTIWWVLKKGICVSYENTIPSSNISKMVAGLNANKALKYDETKKGWVNTVKKYIWKIENLPNQNAKLTCKLF